MNSRSSQKTQRRGTVSVRGCAWLWCFWLLSLVGCEYIGKPNPADRPVPDNKIVAFEPLFARNCAGCHGADGEFGPAPPLSDPMFLAIVPDSVLLETIRFGRAGTPMPAFEDSNGGPLTDAQVTALATGLKTKWKAASLAESTPGYLLAEATGDSSNGDRERGAEIFVRACADCHGVRDATGHVAGANVGAIDDPAFLALISNQALRRIIITGRPDLGMPDYAGTAGRSDDFQPLSSADIDDLVALLASWRTRTEVTTTQQP